jgi:hypothetical protein
MVKVRKGNWARIFNLFMFVSVFGLVFSLSASLLKMDLVFGGPLNHCGHTTGTKKS